MRWLAIGTLLGPATIGTGDGGMRRFEDCDDLRAYTVDAWVEAVVSAWYGGGVVYERAAGEPAALASDGNVQEPGLDEPDLVETDGEHLYVVQATELSILDAVPPEAMAKVGAKAIPGYGLGLLLGDGRGVLVSVPGSNGLWTRAEVLDFATPADPGLVTRVDVEGTFVDGRRIGDDVYLVVATWLDTPRELWRIAERVALPEWDASGWPRDRAAALFAARRILRPYVEELVAGLDDEDLVPGARVDGEPGMLLACDQLWRPGGVPAGQIVSVVHLDLTGASPLAATGVFADGWMVYASAEHLYVASAASTWLDGGTSATTRIHRFALAGAAWDASGSVPGWLPSRFAMDEEAGALRLATSEWDATGASTSVFVLEARDGALVRVGELRGLAPGEYVYATRFEGDVGYLATYLQVDPLLVLDLRDPALPVVAGELVVPGWSSYLHPWGADRLVAVGMDGEEAGVVTDLSLSLYDVGDLAAPSLVARETLATDGSWSDALWDPHAFLLYENTLALPVYGWTGTTTRSGLAVYHADPGTGFVPLGLVEHGDLSPACDGAEDCAAVAWMRRALVIGDALYSVSDLGVKASSLADPTVELGRVAFSPSATTPPE
ncbi:MAG: beta-propeller domain-containing protein [Myxococcota bacterium]